MNGVVEDIGVKIRHGRRDVHDEFVAVDIPDDAQTAHHGKASLSSPDGLVSARLTMTHHFVLFVSELNTF